MISAGNDIVSLTATNVTRTKSPEFYAKIISPAEKKLSNKLDQAVLPFDRFVWLLWSIKESAYKYLHRLDPGIVFTPVKFEVQSIEIPLGFICAESGADKISAEGFEGSITFNGLVIFGDKKLFSRTMVFSDFIASFVNIDNDFAHVFWGIKRIEDSAYQLQSGAVREFVLDELAVVSGLENLAIEKNDDEIPFLLSNGRRLEVPVSLSHHERWVAFSAQTQALVLR